MRKQNYVFTITINRIAYSSIYSSQSVSRLSMYLVSVERGKKQKEEERRDDNKRLKTNWNITPIECVELFCD